MILSAFLSSVYFDWFSLVIMLLRWALHLVFYYIGNCRGVRITLWRLVKAAGRLGMFDACGDAFKFSLIFCVFECNLVFFEIVVEKVGGVVSMEEN